MIVLFVNTLVAFAGVVLVAAAAIVAIMGGIVLLIARAGDRPVELSPRAAAICAVILAGLVGSNALAILISVSQP